jgi:hypothetical protein
LQVNQAFIAEDVRENFETGLEYAEAAAILRMVQRGDQRQYLVRYGLPVNPMQQMVADAP